MGRIYGNADGAQRERVSAEGSLNLTIVEDIVTIHI